jgi:hypothetical protein
VAKKWIGSAIKHPGRIKAMAKRQGISTSAAASKAAHSSDPSLRAAGSLAKRFQHGDLHGGSTRVAKDSLKGRGLLGRCDNLDAKNEFRAGPQAERD